MATDRWVVFVVGRIFCMLCFLCLMCYDMAQVLLCSIFVILVSLHSVSMNMNIMSCTD